MPATTYRIHLTDTLTVETESAFIAGLESRDGLRVTAVTEGDR